MYKKLISISTATLLMISGLSVLAIPEASATSTTYNIDCTNLAPLTGGGWQTDGLTFGRKLLLQVSANNSYVFVITHCVNAQIYTPINTSSAGTLLNTVTTSGANPAAVSSNTQPWVTSIISGTETVTITAGATIPTLSLANGSANTLTFSKDNMSGTPVKITFVDVASMSDAALSAMTINAGMSPLTLSPSFDAGTVTYSATTSEPVISASLTARQQNAGATISATCNSSPLMNYSSNCFLNTGSNTLVYTVTAPNGTTTSDYTLTITKTAAAAPTLATVSTISAGQVNPVLVVTSSGQLSAMPNDWTINLGTTGLTLNGTNTGVTGQITLTFRGTAQSGTLTIQGKTTAFTPTASSASNTLSIVVPGGAGSSPSNAITDAAAAAKAAAEKVAAAKVTLVDSLKAGKPITANDLNSADITVASAAAADRVNARIQALPAAQRSDLAAIKVIVQKENFVEKVSSPATQVTVNSLDLIRVGLIGADYKNKTEVLRTLIGKDPTSLTSMEKVEAAVKEAQARIQARKDRLAATIAKIHNTK